MQSEPQNNASKLSAKMFRGEQPRQGQSDGAYLQQMIERSVLTPLKTINPNDDPALVKRIKHTMNKGEVLMEWFARTGCSRAQALAMNSRELEAFVAQAEINARDFEPDPSIKKMF